MQDVSLNKINGNVHFNYLYNEVSSGIVINAFFMFYNY
ncbi:putative membrane protein [Escherichia coli DEC3A]|nr:putative membrane protein [Escherichia coli DEC3A]